MTTEQPNDRRKRFRVKATTPPPKGDGAKPRVKAGSPSASALSVAATPQEKQVAKKAPAKKAAKKTAAKKK